MNTTPPEPDDPIWRQAWDWVQAEHAEELDGERLERLRQWLAADPAHARAYEDAARLWLLAGLVPPLDDPGPAS
ncbi:FecR/PupR family sigma factor regulator [Derxia lacustris]|uniref:FecR/PupR family sigma factor regulator n=1 Tax=Derxia lacustris TaxID=764842 RepID=UPI000A177D03|nr:DUF4880 domain-containing protein [Derxia lacustris]